MNDAYAKESLFAYEAMERGFNVSIPFGGFTRYDLILEKNNKLIKIQVKSSKSPKYINCYRISLENQKGKYSKNSIDFYAIYLNKHKVWYIIPVEKIGKKQCIYISKNESSDGRKRSDWQLYKENWDLLLKSTNKRTARRR